MEEFGHQGTSQPAKEVVAEIVDRVTNPGKDPFPFGCKKLAGAEQTYRIRFSTYRVIYSVVKDKRLVEIVRVGHRQSVYKR